MSKNGSVGGGMALEFETVTMEAVPEPPVSRWNKWHAVYCAAKKLGLGERHAVKVKLDGMKRFAACKMAVKKLAADDGLLLCTSRNEDGTEAYFWLVKQE